MVPQYPEGGLGDTALVRPAVKSPPPVTLNPRSETDAQSAALFVRVGALFGWGKRLCGYTTPPDTHGGHWPPTSPSDVDAGIPLAPDHAGVRAERVVAAGRRVRRAVPDVRCSGKEPDGGVGPTWRRIPLRTAEGHREPPPAGFRAAYPWQRPRRRNPRSETDARLVARFGGYSHG